MHFIQQKILLNKIAIFGQNWRKKGDGITINGGLPAASGGIRSSLFHSSLPPIVIN